MANTNSSPRRLHLIDIENLVGGSDASLHEVERALALYHEVTAPGPEDHVVIASGRTLASSAWFAARPGDRRLLGRGVDGADLALLGAVPLELIISRYAGLVIGSGDSCFAPLARTVSDCGVPVTVVAPTGSLSGHLRRAADEVITLRVGRSISAVSGGGVSETVSGDLADHHDLAA